jgi:UDP-N-acetylmuramoyl-tripeptide--D-alanyl-D-alanine ligase
MSMQLPLADIARLLDLAIDVHEVMVTGAKIDSRSIEKGDLFIALAGEKVDGHAYLAQARQAGAVAALVSEPQADPLPQLVVDDVTRAFGQIANYWLAQCQTKVVAITGSNGKTTVKEMVAAILRQSHQVLVTAGNFNNDLGVPLTLCRLSRDDDYAVLEMGASALGDLQRLVDIAQPNVSVVNNVAPAHIEGFGSLEGVAQAKGEIYTGLADDGIAVVNADMPYEKTWHQALEAKTVITFAIDSQADVTAQDIHFDQHASHFMVRLDGEFYYINLPLPGIHNVANALAAISICYALGVAPESMIMGLATVQTAPHRLQLRKAINNATLIDDTYNANQASFSHALKVLNGFDGERWLILGDFGELGPQSEAIHHQLGLEAKAAGVTKLLALGEQTRLATKSFGDGAEHFEDKTTLIALLKADLTENITCLIKGSRFMQLDKLADALASKEEH